MDDKPAIKEYPFLGADEERGYRLFPEELENDECVAFHGTVDAHRLKIIGEGFAFVGELQSLSFAKTSSLALRYACEARSEGSPEGCVLAVRFRALDRPGVVAETSIIHVYKLEEQPPVIGYCIIPADYAFR